MARKRKKPLPNLDYVELDQSARETQSDTEYTTFEVYGSKGQKYRITVPVSYYKHVPREWKWDEQKYLVAELIAEGVPIAKIPQHPDVKIKSRKTIYGWLQHPEFKEHIDGLILETGLASKRERIAGLRRVAQMMFDKIVEGLERVEINEKNIVPMINALREVAKQIAQEKEEFVEQARVEQDTKVKVSGSVSTASLSVEEYLKQLPLDEREELEKEFDLIADHYIQQLRGDFYVGDSEAEPAQ